MVKNKILSLENLKKIIDSKKNRGKRVALCHGVFDLLHLGHLVHFKESKSLGDILVVSITSDNFVNKGPGKPVFKDHQRASAVAALEIVDYVVINNQQTSIKILQSVKPHFYCKGPDYKDQSKDLTDESD